MTATEHELRTIKGIIYKITNIKNNKTYIGQSINTFATRYNGINLEKKHKVNAHLWRAIQKYGKENFYISILEREKSLEALNFLENFYVRYFKSDTHKYGYNIKGGGRNGKQSAKSKNKSRKTHCKKKIYVFKDPNGNLIKAEKGLRVFCKKYKLNRTTLMRVSQGKFRHHKGWMMPETSDLIKQKFISPDGEIYIVLEKELRKFCREKNLNHSSMSKVWRKVHSHHKNWKRYEN